MALEPGMVVGVKPANAYNNAVLATVDCGGEKLCPAGAIPQGCQDTGHLLMVVERRKDGWALCPISEFPHPSRDGLPRPEYIKMGEADIVNHPTHLHVALQTVVAEKFIVPRPHPTVAKAKAAFRGDRLKELLGKISKHWPSKASTPSEGGLKPAKS